MLSSPWVVGTMGTWVNGRPWITLGRGRARASVGLSATMWSAPGSGWGTWLENYCCSCDWAWGWMAGNGLTWVGGFGTVSTWAGGARVPVAARNDLGVLMAFTRGGMVLQLVPPGLGAQGGRVVM